MALFLVDGHALAYRSHYAFAHNPLINSQGEETSAVYGFINTLLTLFDKYSPPYIAVTFDSAGKTFRHEKFEAYKANRKPMPEPLAAQLPIIFAVLDAMRIRHVALQGYEADDIIATLTRRWSNEIPVDIVTGDKDLFQLINDRVRVIRPGRGSVLDSELDPPALEEKIGLKPEQIVDYLALMGDSSDNIPGVRGVGEKTAKKLLAEYGNLKSIYEHIDDIPSASLKQKLVNGHEDAIMSSDLVTLDDKVPINMELAELAFGEFRTDEFRELLDDLEFTRMRRSLYDAYKPPPPPPTNTSSLAPAPESIVVNYRAVEEEAELIALAERLASVEEFAVDTETSSLNAMQAVLAGISISIEPGNGYYVPVTSAIESDELSLLPVERAPGFGLDIVVKHLAGIFADASIGKIGQNIKYDAVVLERAGLPLRGITFDTMIGSYCLDPARRSHGLDSLALDLCKHEMIPFSSLFGRTRVKDIRTIPLAKVKDYACEDADFTLRIKHILSPLLEASSAHALFEDVEMPLRAVLQDMEMIGVRVDAGFLGRLSVKYDQEIGEIEKTIYGLAGETFNINSTQKLREILFDQLGLAPARKTKTGYSTDSDVLTGLSDEHEIIAHILRFRQLAKLKSTYVDALPRLIHPETGRVHTSYNQAVASTGRLSSSDPNLQNIPIRTPEGREIRKAFISRGEGWVLLDADYSQIELRILAHLSGDSELVQAFRDDADIHRRTAARVLKVSEKDVTDDMRARAKTVNFGLIYGMGARGLAQSLDIGVDEAREFIEDYFQSYPGVRHFIDDTIDEARTNKCIGTLLGRVRRLPDIDSSNGRARAFSERIAVNTPVQGTAADIIKLAMLEIHKQILEQGLQSRMILQVHDELLFDVPESELETMQVLVRDGMQTAMELDVPLKVDMGAGRNWLEAH